ncbi:MAG: pH-response regulator protein palH/rim21 [Vezdaea aestivalis]|nr:MAG: pH-response regulator protein palH/rim21 [Vezdaea aestivalis]
MTGDLARRQLFGGRTTTRHAATPHCTPFKLPSSGVIRFGTTSTITIPTDVVFQPQCTATNDPSYIRPNDLTPVTDMRDAFYASTLPQIYALAATTALSYMLVIMLLITPRTFSPSNNGGIERRGIIGGASSNNVVTGIGSRPWLQKVATLTVAISLTIASADTFKVAEEQYNIGIMDASGLRDRVVAGLEIRIVRVISDTFLWLAQVQTLIRLFPRHKEKVIIKWTGFALIILDTIFSILNSFAFPQKTRPRTFVDAIPALSYLFQLALSLLYAAWVIYYSLSKRRFAYWHPQMRNICLVALLALISVLIPVVFFVLDISKPDVSGWGDYVRWVGAAAASVVVWEWVERIEALEREDRKDGVLGREIFDGDEMLETTPSEEINWPGLGRHWRHSRDDDGGEGGASTAAEGRWAGLQRQIRPRFMMAPTQPKPAVQASRPTIIPKILNAPRPPSPRIFVTGPARSDTISAASTVYAVHYHPVSEATPPPPPHSPTEPMPARQNQEADISLPTGARPEHHPASGGRRVLDLFRRQRDPPAEVSAAQSPTLKSRMSNLTLKMKRNQAVNISSLPVTVIPAQQQDRTWSPHKGDSP